MLSLVPLKSLSCFLLRCFPSSAHPFLRSPLPVLAPISVPPVLFSFRVGARSGLGGSLDVRE